MATRADHTHHNTFPYREDETIRDAVRSSKRRLLFQQGSELIQRCGGHVVLIYADEDENTTTYTNRDDLWQLLVGSGLQIKETWSGKLCTRNNETDSCLETLNTLEESSEQKTNQQGLLPCLKAAVSGTSSPLAVAPSLYCTTIFTDDDPKVPKSEPESPEYDRFPLHQSEINGEIGEKDDDVSLDGDVDEGGESPDIYDMSTSDYDCEDNEKDEQEGCMSQSTRSTTDTSLSLKKCAICDIRFSDSKAMKAHMQEFERNSFNCQLCLTYFCTSTMRDEHEEQCSKHTQQKPKRRKCLNCLNCGIPWKDHKVADNSGKKPKVQCCMCESQLSETSSLHLHIKKHLDIKEYLCSTCGSAHFTRKLLQMHETEHDKNQCTCPDCGKVLKNAASLSDHVKYVHKYKQLECPSCDEVFTSRSKLYVHRKRVHDGNYLRYACEVCGKQFSNPSRVKRHMITHSGEKPHKCPICGHGFPQPDYVKHHAKSVHGVDITKLS